MQGLSKEEAISLCHRIRERNEATLFSSERRRCRQCQEQSGGDPDRMLMARLPQYLGCDQIAKMRARSMRARIS